MPGWNGLSTGSSNSSSSSSLAVVVSELFNDYGTLMALSVKLEIVHGQPALAAETKGLALSVLARLHALKEHRAPVAAVHQVFVRQTWSPCGCCGKSFIPSENLQLKKELHGDNSRTPCCFGCRNLPGLPVPAPPGEASHSLSAASVGFVPSAALSGLHVLAPSGEARELPRNADSLSLEDPIAFKFVGNVVFVDCALDPKLNRTYGRVVDVHYVSTGEELFTCLVQTAAGDAERIFPGKLLRRLPQYKLLDDSPRASIVMNEFLKLKTWDG